MATSHIAEKDRHSRMVYSTINAPAKKDGAGGAYTWGSATDVPTDWAPIGVTEVAPKVVVAAAPVQYITAPAVVQSPMNLNLRDKGSFPALVGGPRPLPPAQWGPVVTSPPVVLDAHKVLRPGSQNLFDSTHPRNTFAKKVSTVQADIVTPAAPIDWSAGGMTGMQQQMVRAVASNPAHLSIYQQVPQHQPSVQELRHTAPPVITQFAQPAIVSHNIKPTFIKPNMTQARAR